MIPSGDAMAVSAHIEHNETHKPCSVHVIKNCVDDGLIDLNLLSSPSFLILIKRNDPSLNAHIVINIAIIIFPIFKVFS